MTDAENCTVPCQIYVVNVAPFSRATKLARTLQLLVTIFLFSLENKLPSIQDRCKSDQIIIYLTLTFQSPASYGRTYPASSIKNQSRCTKCQSKLITVCYILVAKC